MGTDQADSSKQPDWVALMFSVLPPLPMAPQPLSCSGGGGGSEDAKVAAAFRAAAAALASKYIVTLRYGRAGGDRGQGACFCIWPLLFRVQGSDSLLFLIFILLSLCFSTCHDMRCALWSGKYLFP